MFTNKILIICLYLSKAYDVFLVKFCSNPDCLQEENASLDISPKRTSFRTTWKTKDLAFMLAHTQWLCSGGNDWMMPTPAEKKKGTSFALHKQIAIEMHGWWSICINVIQTVKTQCLSNWENDSAFSPIKITNWRKNHFSDPPRCFKHGIYSVHFACRYAHRRVSSGIVDKGVRFPV